MNLASSIVLAKVALYPTAYWLVGGDPGQAGGIARGAGGAFCNPAGTGLGLPPTAATNDPLVHAFLWVKRPGESDGSCGECSSTPAGQFCRSYALELARRAAF